MYLPTYPTTYIHACDDKGNDENNGEFHSARALVVVLCAVCGHESATHQIVEEEEEIDR